MVENVKGFETSNGREPLLDMLRTVGYSFQEFILSPDQVRCSKGLPETASSAKAQLFLIALFLDESFSHDLQLFNSFFRSFER